MCKPSLGLPCPLHGLAFPTRDPRVDPFHCIVNAELMRRAVEKVGNPNVVVNLVSRRVRQLNGGGGNMSRPLVSDTAGLGVADIALVEIIEDKIGWEPALDEIEAETTRKRRRRGSSSGAGAASSAAE